MEFTTIGNAKKQTGLSYLGGVNISSKLKKNMKVNVMTYCLYLSPAYTSGYDVCEYSTVECRLGCLATSGRAKMEINSDHQPIANARIKKTKLFFEERQFFFDWLIRDIDTWRNKAEKKGYLFNVRLNGTSDIDWQNEKAFLGLNIFEIFPSIQFYDYTKNDNKFINTPINYHLTYSYHGRNWDICQELLEKGISIAMVFNVKNEADLLKTYKGYTVSNGDLNDNRVTDAKGVVVGLKWKKIANKANEERVLKSVFVVNPTDKGFNE
jgi:hypothetical protein